MTRFVTLVRKRIDQPRPPARPAAPHDDAPSSRGGLPLCWSSSTTPKTPAPMWCSLYTLPGREKPACAARPSKLGLTGMWAARSGCEMSPGPTADEPGKTARHTLYTGCY